MVELEHPNIRFLCYFDSYLTERTHSLELQEGDHNCCFDRRSKREKITEISQLVQQLLG